MEDNPYNIICFQEKTYIESAKLIVSPKEDAMIRVFTAWYPSDSEIEIPEQELLFRSRNGFTVVEWGGSKTE